jgi:hypothetical protein
VLRSWPVRTEAMQNSGYGLPRSLPRNRPKRSLSNAPRAHLGPVYRVLNRPNGAASVPWVTMSDAPSGLFGRFPSDVPRSSPRIFLDLAHLGDTRKAHQWLHWAPSLRRRAPRRERRSKRRPGPGRRTEGHLLRDHPSLRPTDYQVWEIVQTRAYDFEFFDPRYAEVILE